MFFFLIVCTHLVKQILRVPDGNDPSFYHGRFIRRKIHTVQNIVSDSHESSSGFDVRYVNLGRRAIRLDASHRSSNLCISISTVRFH